MVVRMMAPLSSSYHLLSSWVPSITIQYTVDIHYSSACYISVLLFLLFTGKFCIVTQASLCCEDLCLSYSLLYISQILTLLL